MAEAHLYSQADRETEFLHSTLCPCYGHTEPVVCAIGGLVILRSSFVWVAGRARRGVTVEAAYSPESEE